MHVIMLNFTYAVSIMRCEICHKSMRERERERERKTKEPPMENAWLFA
jgi:hypothetical protein